MVSFEFVDHGGRQGNTPQALEASSEALDDLHQAICPASYHRICMAIKIASDLPTFFVVVNSLLPPNIAK